jgi:hypothetical protein
VTPNIKSHQIFGAIGISLVYQRNFHQIIYEDLVFGVTKYQIWYQAFSHQILLGIWSPKRVLVYQTKFGVPSADGAESLFCRMWIAFCGAFQGKAMKSKYKLHHKKGLSSIY